MFFPGAPSALRGYRLQHLYSTFRILETEGGQGFAFRLEGSEDLEIFDDTKRLIEAIQVKARSSAPLAPSALTTAAGESFFVRSRQRLALFPESKQRVVSFGDIGPTLQALDGRSGDSSDEQIKLLARLGVPPSESAGFRAALEVEHVDEEAIEGAVMARLASTVTGVNAEVAFLFLSGWMYRQMEERRTITAADVRDKLLAVGRFIAEAHARATEWFTTIVPLEEDRIDDARRARLVRDFYEGVSARHEHILAGVDVVRAGWVGAVGSAFANASVVVVHGASGQGKTALALRYLSTAEPAAWRFRIRELQDVSHARRVATALRAHADAVGVPMIVWFDVAPRDTAWTRVVEDLEALSDTRVLITIREEDWTRARNAGATLRYTGIGLTLDAEEARQIFDGLQQHRISSEFLDFDDAWRQFGGAGPLMEFSYLVTRGDALETKLEQQIRRLREEARQGIMSAAEIELLRRVAVATAAGGRVRLQQLVADLALGDRTASLGRFEREYLLRLSSDGLSAEGLHPLRSATIARLLTLDALDPSWMDTAVAVLPAVHESDLEAFLLSLFSRLTDVAPLKSALKTFKPESWSGAAGVVRALLWSGMQEYVSANAALINEVVESRKGSEIALAVLDPAGLQMFSPGLTELMNQIFSATPELGAWYDDVRARKPPADCVTKDAAEWLRGAGVHFGTPSLPGDWAGMAELLFWSAAWDIASEDDAAAAVGSLAGPVDVPLEAAADAMLALSFWDEALLPTDFEKVRESFIGRFRDVMRTVLLERDGSAIAHYIAKLEASENLHDETIRRLSLMRRLLPHHSAFGAQAYGHIFGSELFPHDPSLKKSVPASSFPIPWVVRLTRLFSFIAGVQMRGASWGAYADTILKLRRRVANLASETSAALRRYFSKKNPRNIFDLGVAKEEWFQVGVALKDLPRVPASFVDAWGVELRHAGDQQAFELPPEHAEWSEILQTYADRFYDFLDASTPYLLANPHRAHPMAGSDAVVAQVLGGITFNAHLATYHLAEVVRSTTHLQRRYRTRFARFIDPATLAQLESDERNWIWTLWAVWYQFADQPAQHFTNARHEAVAAVDEICRRRFSELKKRLASISEAEVIVHAERGRWDEGQGLWVTMNVQRSGDVPRALELTLTEIVEALRPPPDFHALDWYALDLVWREVHVVPLVHGRSVGKTAWHFRLVALPQPGEPIEMWKLLDLPVDEEIWRELHIAAWPSMLGGAARRLHAELAGALALLNHLLAFEDAPEPDERGMNILDTHRAEVLDAVRQHAARALEAAPDCHSVFPAGDPSLLDLLERCDRIEQEVKSLDPLSFDTLRSLTSSLHGFIVTTLTTVLNAAIDQELDTRSGRTDVG